MYCVDSRELGIGIVAYSPIGRRFFGGRGVTEEVPAVSNLVVMNMLYCLWLEMFLFFVSVLFLSSVLRRLSVGLVGLSIQGFWQKI